MLGHVGKDVADIDYYVMHQANRMINNTIRQKVGGSPAQWPSSLEQYGNTSSASIPVTISSQLSAEAQQRPLHWILCGFGIGLSWGTLYLQTEPFYAPEPFVLEHRYDFQPTRIS
ncbi:3-oxoacyl-[acyl-carrier-protein] synthase III C-terminal domain-containing protein [Bordetella holmesii]|nr:3-oxoacyl-[acyl-carrier-protein] synthase III C-terminal domain-containing protein [Bordetella holmesii]